MTLQPVLMATSEDQEGQLVFVDGRLVAVLTRLSPLHGDQAGRWFLETGYGAAAGPQNPSFPDIDAALAWLTAQLANQGHR